MAATIDTVNRLSILTTVLDAVMEIRRGRRRSGLLLLAAAALSSRAPGLGTLASITMRLLRRFR